MTLKKVLCLLLAATMVFAIVGCGKDDTKAPTSSSSENENEDTLDVDTLIGTWQGSDHDEENVVHYLIFDENGYWNIYMNYPTLLRAIKQKSDQLVSFTVFLKLQNSDHTGCFYEYVEDSSFVKQFVMDEDGNLMFAADEDVLFTQVSTESGEPSDEIVAQARDLFDRALVEANSK